MIPCKHERVYPTTRASRLVLLDIARGVALVAMAVYHFSWDLEYFGYLDQGTILQPGWVFFARSIAFSFMFLVGIGLFLGHGDVIRKRPFFVRLAKVALAAAAITIATWFAMPQGFIFFGILHSIALGSVLALPLIRLPWIANVAIGAFFIAGARFLSHPFFDAPVWYWTGLSTIPPHSNDYEPVFPWFGIIVLGLAAGRLAKERGFFTWLGTWNPDSLAARILAFLGRHSLATYLVHQPVLFGSLFLLVFFGGGPDRTASFINACEKNCVTNRGAEFCQNFCACVTSDLKKQNLWQGIHRQEISIASDQRVQTIIRQCTARPSSQ